MSQENVEVVRRLFEAWGVGDFSRVEAFDPKALFVVHPPNPEQGAWLGIEQATQVMLAFLAHWKHYVLEATEFRVAGDSVLVSVVQRGHGTVSGLLGDSSGFVAITLRAGRIIRWDFFMDEIDALEAVGLSE